MHLAEIKVEGFRNLEHVVVALEKGLNVLVGPNNVGKTNLLDAVRVALGPTAATDGAAVQVGRDDFYRSKSVEAPSAPIRIDLTFREPTKAQIAHFHELAEPNLQDLSKSVATLHFEASWDEKRGRATHQRWGGSERRERASISVETLQALPVTFLPALRDAEAALTPGYRNRIAHLFRDRIERDSASAKAKKDEMVTIFDEANSKLIALEVVKSVTAELTERVEAMAGADYVEPTIAAAPPEFYRILRTLCVGLSDGPVSDVAGSGLGFSNLLYVGAVLTHLSHAVEGDQPLLIVEEPEAHLHPQLVQLLARELQAGSEEVQTLVSTHSPALAASVDPRRVRPMFKASSGEVQVGSLSLVGMDDLEARQLERMMDMTRASLLFARAAILVEGVSEALLIPALAAHKGIDLRAQHISVIPIAGVAFGVFEKLLGDGGLRIPVAIITDSDPSLVTKNDAGERLPWDKLTPKVDHEGNPVPSARATKLKSAFAKNPSVSVFTSSITLEHELAAAGAANPAVMVGTWEGVFSGTPKTLNASLLEQADGELAAEALIVWRGICLSNTSGSKAEFAHALTAALESGKHSDFTIPDYIQHALAFVVNEAT